MLLLRSTGLLTLFEGVTVCPLLQFQLMNRLNHWFAFFSMAFLLVFNLFFGFCGHTVAQETSRLVNRLNVFRLSKSLSDFLCFQT